MICKDVSKSAIIKVVNLWVTIRLAWLGGWHGGFIRFERLHICSLSRSLYFSQLCLVCSSCVYSSVLLMCALLSLSLILSPSLHFHICIFCIRVCCCCFITLFALSSAFHLLFTTFLCCFLRSYVVFISLVHIITPP